jgi:uncharacterized protein
LVTVAPEAWTHHARGRRSGPVVHLVSGRLAAEADMLDPNLLDILACPRCKGTVAPTPDHSGLDCLACRLRYRVEDDIPIMLIEEAEPLPRESTE